MLKDSKFITFQTTTTGVKDDKGNWEVVMNCEERLSVDGENWETGVIAFKAIDTDHDEAIKTVLKAYYNWMSAYAWSKNIDSLIEAKEQMELEESNNNGNNN